MEPPSPGNVTVLNQTSRPIDAGALSHAAQVALAQHGIDRAEVCLLLTDDAHMRELNAQFRGLDEATDVLTFPSGLAEGPLGDVAISVETAERQASARGVSFEQELGYLAIHGALHLAGLDDEEEHDRERMMREMNRAAVAAGLPPDPQWSSLLHEESR